MLLNKEMFGKRLRGFRVMAGYSQEALAEHIGVNYATVGNWENGKTEPRISEFIAIAKVFNVSLSELAGDAGARMPVLPVAAPTPAPAEPPEPPAPAPFMPGRRYALEQAWDGSTFTAVCLGVGDSNALMLLEDGRRITLIQAEDGIWSASAGEVRVAMETEVVNG